MSAPFSNSVSRMHDSRLRVFGRDVVYTSQQAGPSFGSTFTVRAILDKGAESEEVKPGAYAALFVKASGFPNPPARGDEITVDNSIYKIVDIDADGEGGLRLVLHFHREIIS